MQMMEEMDAYTASMDCLQNVPSLLNVTDPGYLLHRYNYITILLTMAVIGCALNSVMVWFLAARKIHRYSPLHLMILQMAVANIFVSLFCLFADGIWNITIEWQGGDFLCRIIKLLQMLSLYATTLILSGMSVETCITMTYPITKSNQYESFCRVKIISGFAWMAAAFCSVPQAVIFHTEQAPICVEFFQCVTHGFYSSPAQELAYTMVTLCLMGILPLAVIVLCFAIILIKLSREAHIASGDREFSSAATSPTCAGRFSPRLDQGAPMRTGKRLYRKSRKISLLLTLATGALFAICWGYLFQWNISHETLSGIFCFALKICQERLGWAVGKLRIIRPGTSYSVVNPLLYGGFLLTRKTMRNYIWKTPPKCPPKLHLDLSFHS